MDKFPKMETIEATLFGQRIDERFTVPLADLSFKLAGSCPEWERAVNCTLEALISTAQKNLPLNVCVSVCLANVFQAGVTAERARAECEQLTSAMVPQKGEGLCDRGSYESIT